MPTPIQFTPAALAFIEATDIDPAVDLEGLRDGVPVKRMVEVLLEQHGSQHGQGIGDYCIALGSAADDDFIPCGTCMFAKWGTQCPLLGVLVTQNDQVECCDDCSVYNTDFEAAQALAAECRERGLSDRIRHTIDGYDVAEVPS